MRRCVNDVVQSVNGVTDLNTRDLVTTGKVLGVGGTTLGRCTHTVLVVLTDKDAWEVPQFRLPTHTLSVSP